MANMDLKCKNDRQIPSKCQGISLTLQPKIESMKTEVLNDKDYGIASTLVTLGIEKINNGACTGTEWLQTKGEPIESYSPADG